MPRPSRLQKAVQSEIQSTPKKPRKKRERKALPYPFKHGLPVRVEAKNFFKGVKLGQVDKPCKYDNGIIVRLSNPTHEGVAEYVCVQVERGDTIAPIEKSYG